MPEICVYIEGRGLMPMEPVCRIGSTPVYADGNTQGVVTGEFTGADELTDLGITYRELDKILKRQLP